MCSAQKIPSEMKVALRYTLLTLLTLLTLFTLFSLFILFRLLYIVQTVWMYGYPLLIHCYDWWQSQSSASLLYEKHLSELTNAITFLVGEQLQLVATATIGAASESLSCTFLSWLQLRISILMHLDLSCAYPSQWILISVAHLHLDTSRSQLCISILMRLDLSCASPS